MSGAIGRRICCWNAGDVYKRQVEYRAAAAAAAGQAHVIFFHPAGVALFPRVLRPANDHHIGVAPQKQHALGGGHLAENTLFNRKVEPGTVSYTHLDVYKRQLLNRQ